VSSPAVATFRMCTSVKVVQAIEAVRWHSASCTPSELAKATAA
jgi:hypothetical protein